MYALDTKNTQDLASEANEELQKKTHLITAILELERKLLVFSWTKEND